MVIDMDKIKKIAMFVLFHLCLKWLIIRNYRMRAAGKLPDRWHWADSLSVKYGYYVDLGHALRGLSG